MQRGDWILSVPLDDSASASGNIGGLHSNAACEVEGQMTASAAATVISILSSWGRPSSTHTSEACATAKACKPITALRREVMLDACIIRVPDMMRAGLCTFCTTFR